MKTYQSTLQNQFEWIERIEALQCFIDRKNNRLHEYWLLTSNYTILKELPSVEDDLPADVKEDLATQRLLARQNFRGAAASVQVVVLRGFKGIFVNTVNEFGGMF